MKRILENKSIKENLFKSTIENISQWSEKNLLPEWAYISINELIEKESWTELNDRFYKNLEFGTGGMRGRTIGKILTSSEFYLDEQSKIIPKYASVGSAYLNDFNIVKATLGLFNYCYTYLNKLEKPKLVIAHDVRHYSSHFCELVASTWTQCGGIAFIFDGPRPTPQLSFSVRYLKAIAGISITASHNPFHDNGYKVYFKDGGQIVFPHDKEIINAVNAISLKEINPFLIKKIDDVIILDNKIDNAFRKVLSNVIIDKKIIKKEKIKIVFTPIHGTGHIHSIPLMKKYGVEVKVVNDQMIMDPNFSTVDSPNPENKEAMQLGIELAIKEDAIAVIATDPDADRMGVAVKNNNNNYNCISGNNIGSLLLEYRLNKFKQLGIIKEGNNSSTVLIKTFVTTPMQDAIANSYGLKVINTLTGFKWIGEKINNYEIELQSKLIKEKNIFIEYDKIPKLKKIKLLQKYSSFFIFGSEESYGYLADDNIRDKDANGASLQFCELLSYLKYKKTNIFNYLDSLYFKYGYFDEVLLNIYYEGALGFKKIKNILLSYQKSPPAKIGNLKVEQIQNFSKDIIRDLDNKIIPFQDFFFIKLENGFSYAVRSSGTEPKIKFYIFAKINILSPAENLNLIKEKTKNSINDIKNIILCDTEKRANSN